MDLAIFLFFAVPIIGGILRRVMGRKLGALVTGAGVGTIALLITSSIVIAAIAAFVALLFSMMSGAVPGLPTGRRGGFGGGPWIGGGGGGGGWGGGGRRRLGRLRRRWGLWRRRRVGRLVMAQDRLRGGFLARMLRHRWLDESDTRKAIPPDLMERLARRIAASEKRHTGEVRIYVEAGLPMSYLWRNATPRERAVAIFGKLRVWDTEDNNGVLIYLLLAEHAIEIVADRGLARHVAPDEWRAIVDAAGCGPA